MEHSQWAGHRPSRLPIIFSHRDSSDIGTLIHPHLTCLATEVLRGGHENRVLEPGPPRAPELGSRAGLRLASPVRPWGQRTGVCRAGSSSLSGDSASLAVTRLC